MASMIYPLIGHPLLEILFWKASTPNPTRYAINLAQVERHTAEIRIKGLTSESRACLGSSAKAYLASDRGIF